MSDAVTLARSARESLARALQALQSDPQVPAQLLDLAGLIARAMSSLHAVEHSNGTQLVPGVSEALAQVQTALARLQSQPASHPAVSAAITGVASALSILHAMTRAAPAAAVGPAQQARPRAPPTAAAAASASASAPAGGAARAPQPSPALPRDVPIIAAELGAHSPSNFYKGLAGNDIVDHGGLFVCTYRLPMIGQTVRLKVSMPGGYEFEANAVVRWQREASDAGSDTPPGFGAQFTEITPDARHLVYRYVRNREPMFHDDL